jgi:hypothetical protein
MLQVSLDFTYRRLKLDPCLSTCTKNNSSGSKTIICQETLKQLHKLVGNTLEHPCHQVWLGDGHESGACRVRGSGVNPYWSWSCRELCEQKVWSSNILPPVEGWEFHNMMVIWRQITDSAMSVLMLSFRMGILDQCVDSVWSWMHQAQVSLTTWLPGLPNEVNFWAGHEIYMLSMKIHTIQFVGRCCWKPCTFPNHMMYISSPQEEGEFLDMDGSTETSK